MPAELAFGRSLRSMSEALAVENAHLAPTEFDRSPLLFASKDFVCGRARSPCQAGQVVLCKRNHRVRRIRTVLRVKRIKFEQSTQHPNLGWQVESLHKSLCIPNDFVCKHRKQHVAHVRIALS